MFCSDLSVFERAAASLLGEETSPSPMPHCVLYELGTAAEVSHLFRTLWIYASKHVRVLLSVDFLTYIFLEFIIWQLLYGNTFP